MIRDKTLGNLASEGSLLLDYSALTGAYSGGFLKDSARLFLEQARERPGTIIMTGGTIKSYSGRNLKIDRKRPQFIDEVRRQGGIVVLEGCERKCYERIAKAHEDLTISFDLNKDSMNTLFYYLTLFSIRERKHVLVSNDSKLHKALNEIRSIAGLSGDLTHAYVRTDFNEFREFPFK